MKVFLSSTYSDLVDHRRAAAEALERLGQQVGRMEIFGARPEEPLAACLREIEDCHLFVGIYAHRYGYVPPDSNTSITEQELIHALKIGKPIFCFLVADEYAWPENLIDDGVTLGMRPLKEKIRREFVVDTFREPLDLAVKVATSVGSFLVQNSEARSVPPENERTRNERATLVSLLELRKDAILRKFQDATAAALEFFRAGSGKTSRIQTEEELVKQLSKVENLFLELHGKNVEAIQKGQLMLSHELTSHIHAILWLKKHDSDDPFWTSSDIPLSLYQPGGRERQESEIAADYFGAPVASSGGRDEVALKIKQLLGSDANLSELNLERWCLEGWWQPVTRRLERKLRDERLELEALRRGPLETRVPPGGAGRCPYCEEPFCVESRDPQDSRTCRRCRTRMRLVLLKAEIAQGHVFSDGRCKKCGSSEDSALFFGWHCAE